MREVDVCVLHGCVKSQFKHIRLPVNCALIAQEKKARAEENCSVTLVTEQVGTFE